MFKLYSMFVFLLGNGLLCYASLSKLDHPTVILSFLINLICITIGFYRSISKKHLNLDIVIWFFVYTFFYLAPIIQLNTGVYFPNTMPIDLSDVVVANLLLILWNTLYLMFRSKEIIKDSVKIEAANESQVKTILETASWKLKTVYFMLALLTFLVTFAKLKMQYFFGYADFGGITANKSLYLIIGIGFQGITFANWLFAFAHFRGARKLSNLPYFLLSSILLIYMINPFNTNRFYLGFCAIMIIFVFFYKRVTSGKFIVYIFMGLFVFFPFLNYFRYGFKEFEMPGLYELMFAQLTELHFDAYSNIIATINYCQTYGVSYGYQMLGVLLFFVPRSIWVSKPISSGEALGDYIAVNHTLSMSNISNPIMSEFYINFGLIGVIGGALLMAFFVNRLEVKRVTSRYTYSIIAGYLFMIYRGDLMSAFAYCSGTYLVMVYIPTKVTYRKASEKTKNLELYLKMDEVTRV